MARVFDLRLITNVTIEENQRVLKDFANHSIATGKGPNRVERCLQVLVWLSNKCNKPFKDITASDLQAISQHLHEGNSKRGKRYTAWTIYSNEVVIRQFFIWLHKATKTNCPECVAWLIPKRSKDNSMMPDDLLNEAECTAMVNMAGSLQDKAALSLLSEAGIRVGELLNLKIKDIDFNGNIVHARLSGKTGVRILPIVKSVPYLVAWLNQHPHRQERQSPLFAFENGKTMTYEALCKRIRTVAQQAGIKKKVNPHAFRHSAATRMAKQHSEQVLKNYFGWSRGSNMCSVYIHLSGKDLDAAILKPGEGTPGNACVRCGTALLPEDAMCRQCGLPKDILNAPKKNKFEDLTGRAVSRLPNELQAEVIEQMRQIIREEIAKAKAIPSNPQFPHEGFEGTQKQVFLKT